MGLNVSQLYGTFSCVRFRMSLVEGQRVSSVLWVRFPGVRGVETRTCTLKDRHF